MEGVSPVATTSWMTGTLKPSQRWARAGNFPRTSYGKRFVLSGLPECTGQKEGEGREKSHLRRLGVGAFRSLGEGKGNNRSVLECGCRKTKLSGKERGKIDSIRFDLAITGLDTETYRGPGLLV